MDHPTILMSDTEQVWVMVEDEGERKTIINLIHESHELRGRLVHGKQYNYPRLAEITNKTAAYLKESLLKRIME